MSFRWKRRPLTERGADELDAAHKRIAQLQAEPALTRDACELFDDQGLVPPKPRRAIVEGLIARGHSARSACWITDCLRQNDIALCGFQVLWFTWLDLVEYPERVLATIRAAIRA